MVINKQYQKSIKSHGLVLAKIKKHKYSKEQIINVFKMLQKNIEVQEIAAQNNMSNRRVKKLRYILKHADSSEIGLLLTCKFLISSVEKMIKQRVRLDKKLNKLKKG
jgi:hypothetical protein